MGVMNYVEFAESKATDPKTREVLGRAMHEIERIKAIVRNMLIYVRTKSSPTGTCQIRDTVSQTLSLLEGEFKKANILIQVELADNLPLIMCSADSLQQILINLLLNAKDALAECGQPCIDIMARQDCSMVELTVCDNGSGIPDAILSRIFDPFFTTKPPGKGTGLGLSVSHRLIEETGGNIIAYNKKGIEGCCMRLQFRLAN